MKKLNLIYYSSVFFTDCDFPLIKRLQNQLSNVLYIIKIADGAMKGGLLNLECLHGKYGLHQASEISEFQEYKDYLNLDNVCVLVKPKSIWNLKNLWLYIKLIFKILFFKPDAVHITTPLGVSEMLLYLFIPKMLLTVHDPFLHSGEESNIVELKRKISFRVIPKLILLNKSQKLKFISHYKIPERKVFENMLSIYECLNHIQKVKSLQNPFENKRYILCFGHISPYKGIDILCRAMQIVHQHIPELKCIIAGAGKIYFDYSVYEQNKYIHLINRYVETEELVSLINFSLFTVCPYKDATQSGVVASSFAFNKPVLATDVGALGETVLDGITGKLVSPNNFKELADAIIELSTNSNLLDKLSNNIYKMYNKGEKSWDMIAERYIQIYNI